jgi:transcriptional regulator with XRE-family HTH domain
MGYLVKNRLRQIRLGKKLTQWRLGVLADVDGSRISLIEQGAPPRESEKLRLAKALKIDPADIWLSDRQTAGL